MQYEQNIQYVLLVLLVWLANAVNALDSKAKSCFVHRGHAYVMYPLVLKLEASLLEFKCYGKTYSQDKR